MLRRLVISLAALACVSAAFSPAASAAPAGHVTPSACIGRYPICP